MQPEDQQPATVGEPRTEAPAQPQVLVPASEQEFEGKRKRKNRAIIAGGVLALAGAWYAYDRLTAPRRAAETYDSAQRMFNTARYTEAIVSLERAIRDQPGFADAYMLRGRALMESSNLKNAVSDFSKVAELQPENPQGFLMRATVLVQMKRYEPAALDCDRAIALNPRLPEAYNLKGVVMREMGNGQRAIAEFSKAVELQPNMQNYVQRGATYQKLGMHDKAIEDFDEAVRLDPLNPEPLYARAASKREVGDEEGSKEDHQKARRIEGFY